MKPVNQLQSCQRTIASRVSVISCQILCVLGLSLLTHTAVFANEVDKVIKKEFWGTLYKKGGETFYTQKTFSKKTPLLTASYVYPTQFIRDHLGCGSNRQCLRKSPEYVRILSDLHNMVPEDSNLAFKLRSSVFGSVGDEVTPDEFGMRLRMNMVDPSDDRKGDIARIIYYMHDTYGLPLFGSTRELVLWNQNDPPSESEKQRNEMISTIQGTRNSYVDNPERIE